MANEFKAGDIVYLKSGGPAMTVSWVDTQNGRVTCQWFAEHNRNEEIFYPETLTKENPSSLPPPSLG